MKKLLCILAVNFLILVVLLEIFSRSFLGLRRDAKFNNPKSVVNFYYPELKNINTSEIQRNKLNLLILSASVMNSAWGSVEENIKKNFLKNKNIKIKITNVSMPAHTTRDSLLKYKLIEKDKFDIVFIYHGINDVRMNNYPKRYYKNDYGHIQWYREVNLLTMYPELKYYATRYTLNVAWNKLFHKSMDDYYENLEYGKDIKTNYAFYKNIDKIINIAKKREQKVLLGTYAYHQDKNYSKRSFELKKLNYSSHKLPIEVWGKPENVNKNILKNNDIIKRLSELHNLETIDFNSKIPKNKKYFDDCCHLTNEGSVFFAHLIENKLADMYHK